VKHILANRTGIAVVATLLMGSGAMCPTCGHGTRVTSKRWAKCKKCGERVARRDMEAVSAELSAKIATRLDAEARGENAPGPNNTSQTVAGSVSQDGEE
jgi:tRNA(Ile2) C34 agmatinyltransferase TiaS